MRYQHQHPCNRGLAPTNRPGHNTLPAILAWAGVNARGLWLWLLLCAASIPPARAADYTVVKVGVPARTGSSALAMDNSGRVATTSLIRSYLFADNFFANYVEITSVNIASTTPGLVAQGLNDRGDLVGRFRTNGAPANQTRGFIRRADGTFEPFDYPGVASTSISEVNNHGHLVGETRSDLTAFGLIRGFVHTNGVSAELHFPGAALTRAYGINDAGDIVGHYQMDDAVSRPFILRNGAYAQILPTNAPGGLASGIAFSINDNGLVLGTYRDLANVSKTWLMRPDGTFEYPVLPGTGRVINNSGQIAGSFADPANTNAPTPFVATPFVPANYVAHRIALTNSASASAAKINNQGQITGTVDSPDGVSRGYIFDTRSRQEVGRGGFGESAFTEWGGINAAGMLAGYYADPADPTFNTYRAFVRDASGNYQSIVWSGDTNFNFTVDIDEQGRVAGGGGTTAWVWNTNGTFNVFNVPGFTVNGAFGMNDHGLVVGAAWPGFFDTPNGLIYNISNNTATIWNYPAAAQTTLYGINNRGDIVGEFKPNLTSANIPFVRWADGTTQVLDLPGMSGVRVYDINDDRIITGRYKDAANKNRSFFATPTVLVPFARPVAISTADTVNSAAVADLNGDGDLDLLTAAGGDGQVLLSASLGHGRFAPPVIIATNLPDVSAVAAGDLDKDGDLDVLAVNTGGRAVWIENLGSSGFAASRLITDALPGSYSITTGDLDGDGDLDVVAGAGDTDTAAWFANRLNETTRDFGPLQAITTAADGLVNLEAVDLDADGRTDVVHVSANDGTVAWSRNLGGTFAPRQIISAEVPGAFWVTTADLDGDGDRDIIAAAFDEAQVVWFANAGDGTFGSTQVVATDVPRVSTVIAADVNGDGRKDVLAVGLNGLVTWSENLGGSFGPRQVIANRPGTLPVGLAAADLDRDGDADVLVSEYRGDRVSWYENRLGRQVSELNAPAASTYLVGQVIEFAWYVGSNLTVDTTGGVPTLPLTIGANTRQAAFVAQPDPSTMVFHYIVQAGDVDADGIAAGTAVLLNGARIRNTYGADAPLGLPAADTRQVRVDGNGPSIVQVIRADPNPTAAGTVSFLVTFSEAVSGVDADDFAITASGVAGATVGGVTGSGTTWTVSVTTGTGSGTLRLDVRPDATVADLDGTRLPGGYSSGQVFTLKRATEPRVISAYITNEHLDLAPNHVNGRWELSWHVDGETEAKPYAPDAVQVVAGPTARRTRPADPTFDYLGVPGGETVWILPQSQQPDLPYPGVGAEDTAAGTFARYLEPDPRVGTVAAWIRLGLVGIRGPEGGHFALYQSTATGPKVWMATSDGITAQDAVWTVPAGHTHFNWAFTRPGFYELDFVASGFLDANGNGTYDAGIDPYTESGVTTYYFQMLDETRLSIARTDTGFTVAFTTQTGVNYQLERAAEASGPWESSGQPFVGTGLVKEVGVSAGARRGFFRVKASVKN